MTTRSSIHERTSDDGQAAEARVDVREYVQRAETIAADELTDLLSADQIERWRAGERIPAEAYIDLHPSLSGASPAAFELAYGEFVLRESLGEAPTVSEFVWRFPQFAARFKKQLTLHEALTRGDDDPAIREKALAEGPTIPGYEILEELGRGGMGIVYKARQRDLRRLVALKVIRAGAYADPEAASRFRAEAEAVAQFQRPNFVQVYEVGEYKGMGYIALEYVPGGTLQQELAATPCDPKTSARNIEELARAIHYAHLNGIVHRDLKPENVLVGEGHVLKITDFGLAKLLERDDGPTRTGAIMGTPSYMAPEQAHGGSSKNISPATDVYALGAILYEMLTGRPPFKGATPLSTLEQVTSQEPLMPSKFQRHIPRDLEVICLKCLEKEPRRRYTSAIDLADDLRRFLEDRPILARPAPFWERAWKLAKRRPSAATAVACATIAIVVLIAGGAYYNARLRSTLRSARDSQNQADAHARTALEQRNLALKALDQLVYDVQESLGEAPGTRRLRRHLLDTAIIGLDGIARSNEASSPDLSRAVAHEKLGQIFRQVGRAEEGRRQLEQAKKLAELLVARSTRDIADADCLRKACLGLGQLDIRAGRFQEAKDEIRRAVDMAELIARLDPTGAGSRRSLLESYLQLGRAYGFAREFKDADVWLGKTRDMAARWATDDPSNTQAREMLAWSYRKLADIRKFVQDPEGARDNYTKAIAISRRLVADEPGNRDFKIHRAMAIQDLAGVEFRQAEFARARSLYKESIELFSELIAADTENVDPYLWLFNSYYDLGRLEQDDWRFDEAEKLYTQGREHLVRLKAAGGLEVRPDFGRRNASDLDRLIEECRLAPQALSPIDQIRSKPVNEAARLLLIRARAHTARRQLPEVLATLDALRTLQADNPEGLYSLAKALAATLERLDNGRWPAESTKERLSARQQTADRAVALLALAAETGLNNASRIATEPVFQSIAGHAGYRGLVDRLKEH